MSFECKEASVGWAGGSLPDGAAPWAVRVRAAGVGHWSRVYEYPWALWASRLCKGDWVLDAAGGDGYFQHAAVSVGCQVVNVDLDASKQPHTVMGILSVLDDLRCLTPFQADVFDRVVCLSVLEHDRDPLGILRELWRVLRPDGRFVLTFDVADYVRYNHTIDLDVARTILGEFGRTIPEKPSDVLVQRFPELKDGKPGRPHVDLSVLCLACTKV